MIFLNILSSIIIYCPWLVIDHTCKGKNSLQQRNTTRVWFIFIPSTCSYIFVTKCCVSIYFLCFVLHWKLCKALTFFKERYTEHVSFFAEKLSKTAENYFTNVVIFIKSIQGSSLVQLL